MSASMAFRGSIPRWLYSERAIPRIATIEAVTSTAQMAICTASNKSRTVSRRPGVDLEPDLMMSYGSVRRTSRTGAAPHRLADPPPYLWMHQLPQVARSQAPRLDGRLLRARVDELVPPGSR